MINRDQYEDLMTENKLMSVLRDKIDTGRVHMDESSLCDLFVTLIASMQLIYGIYLNDIDARRRMSEYD